MNALALLNNFEREFAKPFFASPFRYDKQNDWQYVTPSTFSSEMTFDEKTSAWTFAIELAGVTKDNLKIDTENGLIRLSGEKTKGVSKGKFETRYTLPEDVDVEKIEASFEDGILSLTLPRHEKKNARAIQIK